MLTSHMLIRAPPPDACDRQPELSRRPVFTRLRPETPAGQPGFVFRPQPLAISPTIGHTASARHSDECRPEKGDLRRWARYRVPTRFCPGQCTVPFSDSSPPSHKSRSRRAIVRVNVSMPSLKVLVLNSLILSYALASRRDAQYLRIRSPTALRCSSLIVRFWLPAALAAFFLPRPTAGGAFPSIASIARCMATSWLLSERSSFRSASRIPLFDIVTCFL